MNNSPLVNYLRQCSTVESTAELLESGIVGTCCTISQFGFDLLIFPIFCLLLRTVQFDMKHYPGRWYYLHSSPPLPTFLSCCFPLVIGTPLIKCLEDVVVDTFLATMLGEVNGVQKFFFVSNRHHGVNYIKGEEKSPDKMDELAEAKREGEQERKYSDAVSPQ
ncbi:hypothetical protein VNO78_23674 [Psophocarpus tetragonolobus]|uniref:Uncharacterized protein n=1 Tax=Psophocarpus tetragonolobus TaxID=3891 RepID=A0AAN9S427_PSOTE